MRKQRTLAQYQTIDLALFALMLVIFEYLIVRAANFWFPGQPYTVSLAAVVTAIVFMRWGPWGAIHAVLAGAVFCYFSAAKPSQYVIYCVGNLLSLAALLLLRRVGKEKVRTGRLSLLFPLLVLVLMQAGRALVAGETLADAAGPCSAAGGGARGSDRLLHHRQSVIPLYLCDHLDSPEAGRYL